MLAWGLGFWMCRQTLTHGILCLLSAECSEIMCRAWTGTLVTWPWLCLSMIYCFALRLWSQMCVTCWSCWFPVSVALSCVGGKMLRARGMVAFLRDGYGAFCQPKFECRCKILVFTVCGVRQNLYVYIQSLSQPWPRWPYFLLFTSINGCRAGWGCSCHFPVFGWFEWPSSWVFGFYDHEPSWSCSLVFHNSLRLRSVGCRPNPCSWWNTWPPADWCSWLSTDCCCSTDR